MDIKNMIQVIFTYQQSQTTCMIQEGFRVGKEYWSSAVVPLIYAPLYHV